MSTEEHDQVTHHPEDVNEALRNADLGETVHVRDETTLHFDPPHDINTRDVDISDIDISEVEIQEGEWGSELKIVWEGQAMKTMPRNCERLPRISPADQSMSWEAKLLSTATTLGVTGLGILFAHFTMSKLAGDMTINGQPLTYTPLDLVPVVGMVMLIALLMWIGFTKGGFPGKVGGRR